MDINGNLNIVPEGNSEEVKRKFDHYVRNKYDFMKEVDI